VNSARIGSFGKLSLSTKAYDSSVGTICITEVLSMKRAVAVMSLATFMLVVGLASVAVAQAADGKALFEAKKCNLCHSIESQGIAKKSEKMKGSELSNIGASIESAESLKKFLTQETMKDGEKHKKKWTGTDEELDTIVNWVMSLKTS